MGYTFKQMDKETAQDEEQSAPQNPAKEDKIEFNGFNPDKEESEDKKMDNYQPIPYQSKSGKKKFILAAVIIVIFLLVGWILKSTLGSSKTELKTESQPLPTPVPIPTSTPKPALIRSEWNLEVLNGSGVTGAAKKLADKITELGYQVVKTGNADKDTYTQNQIFVRANLKDKTDLLIADLKDIIKIASAAGELKDSTASARIIIGKE